METTTPPFERTVCACEADREHCTRQPGYLVPGDMERMAGHLHLHLSELAHGLRASPGAVVGDSVTGHLFRIGTIVPAMAGGRCVFLDDDGRCGVHAVAPFGCSHFDAHMPEAEAKRRSAWGLRLIMTDAQYAAARARLVPAATWEPRTYGHD